MIFFLATMSWRAACSEVLQFRIFLDTTNQQSAGLKFVFFLFIFSFFCFGSVFTRAFVEKNYQELKYLNPTTPFLIRLRDGAPTQVWARYEHGEEEVAELEGKSEAECEEAFKALVMKATPHAKRENVDYVIAAGEEGTASSLLSSLYHLQQAFF